MPYFSSSLDVWWFSRSRHILVLIACAPTVSRCTRRHNTSVLKNLFQPCHATNFVIARSPLVANNMCLQIPEPSRRLPQHREGHVRVGHYHHHPRHDIRNNRINNGRTTREQRHSARPQPVSRRRRELPRTTRRHRRESAAQFTSSDINTFVCPSSHIWVQLSSPEFPFLVRALVDKSMQTYRSQLGSAGMFTSTLPICFSPSR